MTNEKKWRAEVFYREPNYERHRERGPREYRAFIEVEAASESEAEELARDLVNGVSVHSNVGWIREVVRVNVGPLPDSTSDENNE